MNKQTVFRLLIAFAIVLLPLLAASPVEAGGPEMNVIDWDLTWEQYECGFPVTVHLWGTMKYHYFFFEDGSKNRVQDVWGNMKETFSANGKELQVQVSGPGHFREIDNGYLSIGLGSQAIVTIPGQGVVYGGAGQIITKMQWDPVTQSYYSAGVLKEVGQFDWDWGLICAYFSE